VTLSLAVHPEAAAELDDAIAWYDKGGQGRGQQFRATVNEVLDRCLLWPESAPVYPLDQDDVVVRTAGVARSPYRIVYFIELEKLTIVALAHGRRRPGYWRDRVPITSSPVAPPPESDP
jgi:toxin ParE1/3/4